MIRVLARHPFDSKGYKVSSDTQADLSFRWVRISERTLSLILVSWEFNGPVNTIKDMSCRSVYRTTLFLDRLSPLSDQPVLALRRNWKCALLSRSWANFIATIYKIYICGFITNSFRLVCGKQYRFVPGTTVEPRYLELAYFELPLISKWKSGSCFNMKLWQQVTK